MATTRNAINLIGAPTIPATIAASGGLSGTMDMTPSGTMAALITLCLIPIGGIPPSVPVIVTTYVSTDGISYAVDSVTHHVVPAMDFSWLVYEPPIAALKVKVYINNPDTTRSIAAYVQGSMLLTS